MSERSAGEWVGVRSHTASAARVKHMFVRLGIIPVYHFRSRCPATFILNPYACLSKLDYGLGQSLSVVVSLDSPVATPGQTLILRDVRSLSRRLLCYNSASAIFKVPSTLLEFPIMMSVFKTMLRPSQEHLQALICLLAAVRGSSPETDEDGFVLFIHEI